MFGILDFLFASSFDAMVASLDKYAMHEQTNRAELTEYLGVDPVEVPWCAAFMNASLAEVGLKGTGQLTARSFLKIGKKVTEPKVGDIVVFKRGDSSWQGHVGYYMDAEGDMIYVFGGNQSDEVSVQGYPKKDVLGYRRF
jgi:uncharacterized protein (TIGR02594 family)